MRVALLTNFCPHYRRPLFEELGRRWDLELVLTSRGTEWYWEGERPLDTGGVSSTVLSNPLAVAHELRSGRFDAVVAGLTGRATLLAAVRTAHRAGIPFVLWVGSWMHPRTLAHRLSRPAVRRLLRSADAIVTYGAHVSDYVARESGRTSGVFIAAQATDNERFRRRAASDEAERVRLEYGLNGRPVVAFVGRLSEEKGLTYLLHASAAARVPHQLVLAGTGPMQLAVASHIDRLAIGGHARLIGHVDQRRLPAFLQAVDILAVPSVSTKRIREPWGFVVNEAMNAGPVVLASSAVGAAAGGLLIDGETGVVVPERDVPALCAALDRLASDAAERHRLAQAASARVLQWNYAAAADGFDAAIAWALAGR
jgi:glycosyltransferase involved in cell wall biosynthesis